MDKSQVQHDFKILLEAMAHQNLDKIWNEFVEKEKYFTERIYWRNLFFQAIISIHPLCKLSLPKGKSFVYEIEQWLKNV